MNILFKNRQQRLSDFRQRRRQANTRQAQADKTITCPQCNSTVTYSRLKESLYVCPHCGRHYRISARERIRQLTDKNSFKETDHSMTTENSHLFEGYSEKLEKYKTDTGLNEAVVCGTARIDGVKCALAVMDSNFMMGSMGSVVGEKLTALFEYAVKNRLPVIGYTVSGGARMQEGLLSLMQMAKVSGAVKRHSDAGLLYIVVLTDPTTGGVTASFAMEGDIILAEPGATVGFAGARVIEQTTKKSLPKGFQTAEFVLEHGFIDAIVPRGEQRKLLIELLKMHHGGGRYEA